MDQTRHTCTSATQNEFWPLISFLCWKHGIDFYLPFSRNRRGFVSNDRVVYRKLDMDFSRTSDLFARTDVAS